MKSPRRKARAFCRDALVGEGFHALPASVNGQRRTPVKMVRGLCPRDIIRGAVDARRAHRGKRGCNRPRLTSATNQPRRADNDGFMLIPTRTQPP